MKRLAFLLLFLAAPAFGQSVKIPAELRGEPREWIVVPFEADGGPTRWMMPDGGLKEINLEALLGKETAEKSRVRIFKATKPGRYRVWAVTAKARADDPKTADVSVPAECVIVVGETPPPPPTPPGPTPPGPTPPGPGPGPAPIPGDGLRVLIVYESADLSKLKPDQLNVLYSQSVRSYLDTHCAKGGKDGKTPEWRMWDQNVPTGAEAKIWQDAMARKRDKLPWLIVSTGKAGYEGPLPPNTDAMLRTLQTYGGQ
jgi:hypothetical protein